MRSWIPGLVLLASARFLVAQEAISRQPLSLPAATPPPANLPASAWLDLRQNAGSDSVQAAPAWVESVTLIPPSALNSANAVTTFRIRLSSPGSDYTVLFFRLFFEDKPGAQPTIVAWNELGSQVLRSDLLGGGIGVDSSDSVTIPMNGVNSIDVEVPGNGSTVRGAFLDWMTSSVVVHPTEAGAEESVPPPFAAAAALQTPAQDTEQFGTVSAPLAPDPIRIGSTPATAAVLEFGIETPPLLALLTFEIAAPRVDSPPEIFVNGQDVGPATLTLPDLADPGYRGEVQRLITGMQFQYTGWIRAQRIVPASALQAGNNSINIQNGANASTSVIRATQIQLKYLWEKSDYILRPDH